MKVVLALPASRELASIWRYNAEHYDVDHANEYEIFLVANIRRLNSEYLYGSSIPGHPGLLRSTFKQSPGGHGHIAIYRVSEAKETIRILHIYHTAQDWQGRLRRGR